LKLHNRIRMLQVEEERALRKIEETRKKAKNILELRMNKEQKTRRKGGDDEIRAHTPDARSIIFFERKEEHRRVLHERMSMVLQQRREGASLIKREKKILTRRKNHIEKAYARFN